MAWRTGTATDYVDLLNKVRDHAIARHVATAVVAAAGAGYVVGDVVTVAGGTALQAAKAKVTAVGGGGAVTAITLLLGGGSYSADPAIAPNTPTGGTGAGLTLTLTMTSNGWSVLRDATTGSEKELILQGIGSGADAIFVGIRTYRDTNTIAFNWELAGMTGFSAGNPWNTQPGVSPGRNDSVSPTNIEGGSYLSLDNNPMTYWCSVTGRRIIVVAKVGTSYQTAYLGFYNSFSTSVEQPYPLVIVGMVSQKETKFNSTRTGMSFLADPTTKSSTGGGIPTLCPGPFQVRWVDGSWLSFRNRWEDSANPATQTQLTSGRIITPMNYDHVTPALAEDGWVNGIWSFGSIVPASGLSPTFELHPTPNGVDIAIPLWPIGMQMDTPSFNILGEIDGCFWVTTFGSGLVSEDTITVNNEDYLVIQNGFRTDSYQYIAIKEA